MFLLKNFIDKIIKNNFITKMIHLDIAKYDSQFKDIYYELLLILHVNIKSHNSLIPSNIPYDFLSFIPLSNEFIKKTLLLDIPIKIDLAELNNTADTSNIIEEITISSLHLSSLNIVYNYCNNLACHCKNRAYKYRIIITNLIQVPFYKYGDIEDDDNNKIISKTRFIKCEFAIKKFFTENNCNLNIKCNKCIKLMIRFRNQNPRNIRGIIIIDFIDEKSYIKALTLENQINYVFTHNNILQILKDKKINLKINKPIFS